MAYSTRLILANGAILENCECGYYDKTVGCFLKGISFGEAFQYFSDSEKYRSVKFDIEYEQYIDRIEYSGMEVIESIIQRESSVDVMLAGTNITLTKSRIPKDSDDDSVLPR